MTYKLPERLGTIVIDEGDYAGAEIVVRTNQTVGVGWTLDRLTRAEPDETAQDKQDRYGQILAWLAEEVVVEWNLADHRGPIPVTPEGVARLPVDLIGDIIRLWRSARESSPFAKPSPDSAPEDRRPTRRARRRTP